ncbi:MAG TPA: shikimate kinase [Candidatus Nanoarchaeia archaeon]|nr:shikimate kinase [Candidatus Nanoarchaeia archaeon]
MKITITGPRSVGKTTVSKLVAKKLGLKYVSSDEIGEKALKKHGGLDKAIKSGAIGKFIKDSSYGLIRKQYIKDNFIFDLSGGSISSTKYFEASAKVRKIAKDKSIIIGLLPSRNKKESVNLLFSREKERSHFKNMDNKELFKETNKDYNKFPPIFSKLCNLIIYTKGKTLKNIAQEIVNKIVKNNKHQDKSYRFNELKKLYKRDQAGIIKWQKGKFSKNEFIKQNKDIRKHLIKLIIKCKLNRKEYFICAMILHHRFTINSSKQALKYIKKAQKLGYTKQKWLIAAIEDRLLQLKGKPQKYGTQIIKTKSGKIKQYKLDGSITDKKRLGLGLPRLKRLKKELEQ